MAREKGTFQNSANYEPLIAAPFDARSLVHSRADLTLRATWATADDEVWIYDGMLVSVVKDADVANNGLYMLTNAANFNVPTSWKKMADAEEMAGKSVSVQVNNFSELPAIGDIHAIYFVKNSQEICKWDSDTNKYIAYGSIEIDVINGGNANGD